MIQLDQRQLGQSGIMVSPMGVGTWSWGDKVFWRYGQGYEREDITHVYETSLDTGLNFFDTAEIYAGGKSERIIGECMRKDTRPIIVATKYSPMTRFSARTLLKALDASLARLGVECIDLYQIHFPYTVIPFQALMDALVEAVQSGKVKAVGVSNYSASLMSRAHECLAHHNIPLASNQVQYNLLHRKPEADGVLRACKDLQVALIAYSPLAQGLLTGKYRIGNDKEHLVQGPRRFLPSFRKKKLQAMEPLLQTMEHIAQAHEKTISQIALNWLLMRDGCIIPIPGAKNDRQLKENIGALGWSLTGEEYARVDEASRLWVPAH